LPDTQQTIRTIKKNFTTQLQVAIHGGLIVGNMNTNQKTIWGFWWRLNNERAFQGGLYWRVLRPLP